MGCHSSKHSNSNDVLSSQHHVNVSNPNSVSSSVDISGRFRARLESFNVNGGSVELRKVIQNIPELRQYSDEYKEIVLGYLRVFQRLSHCIDEVRSTFHIILAAMSLFHREKDVVDGRKRKYYYWYWPAPKTQKAYKETLEELEEFMLFSESFTEVDVTELQSLNEKLALLKTKLQERKAKLIARLSKIKKWRKVLHVTYTVFNLGVLMCSIEIAIMGAPAAAITGVTSGATGMRFLDPLFDKLWGKEEKLLDTEKGMIDLMQKGGLMEHDIETIRQLFGKIRMTIEFVREDVCFMLARKEDGEALRIGANEIKSKIGEMDACINSLKVHVESCASDLQNMASDFLTSMEK